MSLGRESRHFAQVVHHRFGGEIVPLRLAKIGKHCVRAAFNQQRAHARRAGAENVFEHHITDMQQLIARDTGTIERPFENPAIRFLYAFDGRHDDKVQLRQDAEAGRRSSELKAPFVPAAAGALAGSPAPATAGRGAIGEHAGWSMRVPATGE